MKMKRTEPRAFRQPIETRLLRVMLVQILDRFRDAFVIFHYCHCAIGRELPPPDSCGVGKAETELTEFRR